VRDRELARHYIWRTETTRPGVKPEHVAVIRQLTPDLKQMQRIREEFEKRKAEIFDKWEQERKAAEEKKAPPAEEQAKETIEPQGPQPPNKPEEEKEE
jgi:hypothetical protein